MESVLENLDWAGEIEEVKLILQCDEDVHWLLLRNSRGLMHTHLDGSMGWCLLKTGGDDKSDGWWVD
jgi:hypothetical protein